MGVPLQILLRELFNFWPSGERDALISGKFVQHVPNADVKGFSQHPVSALQTGNDLRVSAGHIQQNRVVTSALLATNFDVCHAMIHADEGDVHLGCKASCDSSTNTKAWAKAWALGIRNGANVGR